MFEIAYVVARESIEVLVLLSIVLNFFKKQQDYAKIRVVYTSSLVACLSTIVLGFTAMAVLSIDAEFLDTRVNFTLHLLSFLVALKFIFDQYIRKSNKYSKIVTRIFNIPDYFLFLFMFLNVSKEGMEILLFIGPHIQEYSGSYINLVESIFAGIITALCAFGLYHKFSAKFSYQTHANLLNIFLFFILFDTAIDLVLSGRSFFQ